MCHLIYLSTTSEAEFEPIQEAFRLRKVDGDWPVEEGEMAREVLLYPQIWFLECQYGGCSCHFRNELSRDMGFGEPEEWCPEDEDDIEATGRVYDFLTDLVGQGHQVDLVNYWSGEGLQEEMMSMDVDLSTLPRAHFRFFASTYFRFVAT